MSIELTEKLLQLHFVYLLCHSNSPWAALWSQVSINGVDCRLI